MVSVFSSKNFKNHLSITEIYTTLLKLKGFTSSTLIIYIWQGGELAAVIREGRVGQPRRDPTTGFLTNHHLGTTDVTRQVGHIYIPLKKEQQF